MRQVQIFSGSSHPTLVNDICDRLGSSPAKAELGKFSNGETKVQLNTSIREQDVFIVQSGSDKINDNVMELLIMCSACKSGSAKSITAVMPYFPYSRQSKKKSHRGSITARMIANLLDVAGVNHVITIDLHASQMQGFFHCPVDNLVAEPLIAHWIKSNVPDWRRAVVVSKNPGGTKRVTSLADALKLNFGIVMTDRARPGSGRASMAASTIIEPPRLTNGFHGGGNNGHGGHFESHVQPPTPDVESAPGRSQAIPSSSLRIRVNGAPSIIPRISRQPTQENALSRVQTAPSALRESEQYSTDEDDEDHDDDDDDPRIRDVVTGRLIHGHIVDDDAPSPSVSAQSNNTLHPTHLDDDDTVPEHMLSSVISTASSYRHHGTHHGGHGLGGSGDAIASSDDEEECLLNPELESTVTLVGNVRDRPVFLLDDMIDKSASWIAAAETVVKRGGATKVYCMATHGLFGNDCLEEMDECNCIDGILVTNAFPIPQAKRRTTEKLDVIDVSGLLAEAIRRNHHGESIERLYGHWD